jgi:hypothetical protein
MGENLFHVLSQVLRAEGPVKPLLHNIGLDGSLVHKSFIKAVCNIGVFQNRLRWG